CASCHDPHDNTFAPFLAADNTDSALCVHCHVK
ncbi:MAG: cytochrome C, partial [Gemmatimonadetes bacterium]|nr:cytochrome C [Gemmatimonadota bacterium]NIT67132.1 cytochrome C [Gemmatimonadota bacterium]NIV23915.1 cytochrome C [Gemmatimonadota bacterium]NIW36030.1 cytochrome C [Gemmatimonadota bacterium]NIW75814.1 cytochrome C [Gemmatimonadota bacterium]